MTSSPDVRRRLSALGIQPAELYHNLSFDELFDHETGSRLAGHEKAQLTSLDAVAVDTGKFTGRNANDKYVVLDGSTRDTVWWSDGKPSGSDNKPISPKTWAHLKELSARQLNAKDLYVVDGFCGANKATRLSVRLVAEVAWMAHFFKNMFIRPTQTELKEFKPDWTILNACKTSCRDFAEWGLRSEVFIAFNIAERMTVIGGTWYGGEMKKGIFSVMNYFLPLKGIGSFHCSANMGPAKDTALFFGLSGTGKTTLSTDPKRLLIGDDEHGWDSEGIFNFEGGCYAKTIGLTPQREPQVYAAIRRNALLENVAIGPQGHVDFASDKKTENTRVSYPIEHIDNIVKPLSKGGHPSKIIFLACDAYGVLPPVAKLDEHQAMYHFLSGYTAKVAGTEHGIKHPQATFSACFGKAFLMLHPVKYAEILAQKMREHGSSAYLINTGWVAGPYSVGHRIALKDNRLAVDAILDGSIDQGGFDTLAVFNLQIPRQINGVDGQTLNPRRLWADGKAYDASLRKLAALFVENFKIFTDTPLGLKLADAGPRIAG
ncbi:MAG: phosphoenolpyruvate carboxykinase (ATP) [Candidatus Omnitrophica bacterium]|nr:phosphoenolpyruvate carboxykinase (ATP) [Candidatus Omnitrophota bacterium]MDE2221813.1 phosphoenolpyruvate carboxykinase (ATP) [Candidatus Omnitrophota bacterium]